MQWFGKVVNPPEPTCRNSQLFASSPEASDDLSPTEVWETLHTGQPVDATCETDTGTTSNGYQEVKLAEQL